MKSMILHVPMLTILYTHELITLDTQCHILHLMLSYLPVPLQDTGMNASSSDMYDSYKALEEAKDGDAG